MMMSGKKGKKGFSVFKTSSKGSDEVQGPSDLFCWGKIPSEEGLTDFPLTKITLSDKVTKNSKSTAVISVASSQSHIVGVTNDFVVVGTGDNEHGQLYPLNLEKKTNMLTLEKLPIHRDVEVVQVSCGKNFTAYLTNIGRVYTFGDNSFGQLGHSQDRSPETVPARMVQGVPHEVCVQVACGDYSTYVLTKHGKVYACGNGKNGRLGVASLEMFRKANKRNSKMPTFISEILQDKSLSVQQTYLESNRSQMTEVGGPLNGAPIVHLAAGSAHCVAVASSGAVYGWGSNSHGQLGISNPTLRNTGKAFVYELDSDDEEDGMSTYMDGVPLPTLLNVENILLCAAGGNHTLFLANSQSVVYSVGSNSHGQLGSQKVVVGTNSSAVSVVDLGGGSNKIFQISAGLNHSMVLTSDGTVELFGGDLPTEAPEGAELVKISDSHCLLTKCNAFDVVASGNLSLVLASEDFKSLLDQNLAKATMLSGSLAIGMTASDAAEGSKQEQFLKLRKTLFDMHTLNASFMLTPKQKENREKKLIETATTSGKAPLDSSFIDLVGMLASMKRFAEISMEGPEKLKVRQLIASLVGQLDYSSKTVTEPDQLRAYFMLCLSPLLQEISPAEHEILAVSVFKMPIIARRRFFSWIYADVAQKDVTMLIDLLVKPLLKRLDLHLSRRTFTNQAVSLCKFLHCLFMIVEKLNEKSSFAEFEAIEESPAIPSSAFYTEALDDAPDFILEDMYQKWHAVVTQGGEALNGPAQQNRQGAGGLFRAELNAEGEEKPSRKPTERSNVTIKPEFDGPEFGLGQLGGLFLDVVDDAREDTLNEIAPELVIFKHPFLLSANLKRRLMHIEDKKMQVIYLLRFYSTGIDPNFVLEIRRGQDMIEDVFGKLRVMKSKESILLRRPLRIKFVGEEGLDAGGVRKEFFLLLSADLFSQAFGFFKEIGKTNLLWFSNTIDPTILSDTNDKASVTYEEYLKLVKRANQFQNRLDDINIIGILMGLAVYNDTLMDVQFPSAMYELLLSDFDPDDLTLAKYKLFDADGAQQLEYINKITDAEELEALDLNFEVTQESSGVIREVEICPNGSKMKVTMENKEEYIRKYIRFQMYSPFIEGQAKALTAGFARVITAQQAALKLFHPDELELLLVGTPELDFTFLRQKCEYEGGYNPEHPTVVRFWEILNELDYEQRKLFLKFCTGSSRAPVGGLKSVKFKLQRAGPDTNHLPTAHTCFNTLMLPDYSSKDKMRRSLLTAIENSEGFGLQ